MSKLLKSVVEYCKDQLSNLTRETESSVGQTDDTRLDDPSQYKQIQSGTTDAKVMANLLFGKEKIRLPIETTIVSDIYDLTQSCSRMNTIYNMGRSAYYAQGVTSLEPRMMHLARKQQYAARFIRLAKEVKEKLGVEEKDDE